MIAGCHGCQHPVKGWRLRVKKKHCLDARSPCHNYRRVLILSSRSIKILMLDALYFTFLQQNRDTSKNRVCYLGSSVSVEGICSSVPGVVPRSGQTRCCHHPSSSSSCTSSPGLITDTFLSPYITSSHGWTCVPDAVIMAAFACSSPFAVCCQCKSIPVVTRKWILIDMSPHTSLRWWYIDNWDIIFT